MWFGTIGNGNLEQMRFAPDSHTLYVSDQSGRLLAWDTSSRKHRVIWDGADILHKPWFRVSPCGRFILAPDLGVIRVFDAVTGEEVSDDIPTTALDDNHWLSDCGRYYLRYSRDYREERRWDWAARRFVEPRTLNLPPTHYPRYWFALHSNGRATIRAESTDELSLYDTVTGEQLWHTQLPLSYDAYTLFDLTGEFVLVVGQNANVIALRASDGAPLWHKPAERVKGSAEVAFHPTRPLLAIVLPYGVPDPDSDTFDQSAWFGDLRTGERIAMPDPGFERVRWVAFSPDGLTCAVGSTETAFCVFDLDG